MILAVSLQLNVKGEIAISESVGLTKTHCPVRQNVSLKLMLGENFFGWCEKVQSM